MPGSAFPQECTVGPWWVKRALHGNAAASGTHRNTETKCSTLTWDSLPKQRKHSSAIHERLMSSVSRFNTQSALQLIAYYGIILEVKYLPTLFYTGFKK